MFKSPDFYRYRVRANLSEIIINYFLFLTGWLLLLLCILFPNFFPIFLIFFTGAAVFMCLYSGINLLNIFIFHSTFINNVLAILKWPLISVIFCVEGLSRLSLPIAWMFIAGSIIASSIIGFLAYWIIDYLMPQRYPLEDFLRELPENTNRDQQSLRVLEIFALIEKRYGTVIRIELEIALIKQIMETMRLEQIEAARIEKLRNLPVEKVNENCPIAKKLQELKKGKIKLPKEIPHGYIDPITKRLMREPVYITAVHKNASGDEVITYFTYESSSIETWLKWSPDITPMGLPLGDRKFMRHEKLEKEILEWLNDVYKKGVLARAKKKIKAKDQTSDKLISKKPYDPSFTNNIGEKTKPIEKKNLEINKVKNNLKKNKI